MFVSVVLGACDQGTAPQPEAPEFPDIPVIEGAQLDAAAETRLESYYTRIQLNPLDADVNGEFGMFLQGYGFLDAAIACYLRAQRLAPDVFEWPYFLGFSYAANGQLDQAALSLETALVQRPDFLAAQIKLARVYLDLDQLEKAERLYRSAIKNQPDRGEPYFGLGRIAMRRGDTEAAIQSYEKAYELAGHSADLHYALAEAFRLTGDAEKTQAQLELFEQYRDVPIKGNSPLPAAVIAYVSENAAEEQAQPEINAPSASATSQESAGFDVDAEISAIEDELEKGASDPGLYASLMVLYGKKGHVDSTLANYERATQGMGMDPTVHFVAGNIFLSLQEYDQARIAFIRVLKIQPDNANANHQMGGTYDYLGDGDAATSHYRKAIEIDPNREVTRSLLGRRLALAGSYDEAVRKYQNQPGDASVPAWIALARAGIAGNAGDTPARDHWLDESLRIAKLVGDEEVADAASNMRTGSGNDQ